MKQENKKFFAVIIVMILVIVIIATVISYKVYDIKKEEEKEIEKPLYLTIFAEPSSGTAPHTVNFKSRVLNNQGSLKYYWDFGDGNTSNEENPTHTYSKQGLYSYKLTVEDQNVEKIDYGNITVFPNNPPKIKIVVDKTTAFRPATIHFDAEVFDPEGENLEYSWLIKYPPILSYEPKYTTTEKNFSKTFLRNGNYVAELTVTDEAGNSVKDYLIIQIKVSKLETNIYGIIGLTTTFKTVWPFIEPTAGPILYKTLDKVWLNLSTNVQKLIKGLLDALGVNYDPPIPVADLLVSKIGEINLSGNVVDGKVTAGASVSSSFTILNNDSSNTAKKVYITLFNPLSGEKGLDKSIEKKELEVSINASGISKKLFYDGKYRNSTDCFLIEEDLEPGDVFTGDINVKLKEGTFDEGTYNCKLFIYQETADYVDEVPFIIKL